MLNVSILLQLEKYCTKVSTNGIWAGLADLGEMRNNVEKRQAALLQLTAHYNMEINDQKSQAEERRKKKVLGGKFWI